MNDAETTIMFRGCSSLCQPNVQSVIGKSRINISGGIGIRCFGDVTCPPIGRNSAPSVCTEYANFFNIPPDPPNDCQDQHILFQDSDSFSQKINHPAASKAAR